MAPATIGENQRPGGMTQWRLFLATLTMVYATVEIAT